MAASRYLGRANLAVALRSFMAEGVWGTSPHLIPHFALHSASGTISLALGSHGPNLGVGGGLHAVARRVSGGADLAVDRRCAWSVAGLDRLVAGAGSRSGWKCSACRRMHVALALAASAQLTGGGRRSGGFGADCRIATARPLSILAWLAELLGEPGRADRPGRSRPMPRGLVRIELIGGLESTGMRRYGHG